MRQTENFLLHFDLSHCPQDAKFSLVAGDGKNHTLTSYADAPEKLEQHKKLNKALAMVCASHGEQRITHFLEDVPMPEHQASLRRVVYDSLDDHPLPEIAMAFIHLPKKAHSRSVHPHATKKTTPQHMLFSHYGLNLVGVNADEHEQLHEDAYSIKPPYETARALVFQHPEIGTVNPTVAKYVFDNHVENTQDFQDLITYIQENGPGTSKCWYNKSWVQWTNPDTQKEEPIPANMDLQYKDGESTDWPVNPETGEQSIPSYELTDEYSTGSSSDQGVIGAATPVVQKVLKETKNDTVLNGQLWTTQNGVTAKTEVEVEPTSSNFKAVSSAKPTALKSASKTALAEESGSAKGFGLKNTTSNYGLYLYDDELTFDGKNLSFPVKNWPSRYLSLYVQFLKQDGTPIKRSSIDGWNDSMPDFLHPVFEPSDSKNYLDWISSGNAVFGVPVPPLTSKTDVDFLWPQEASSAKVILGGLGVANGFKDWDSDVDVVGVCGTGVVNYGISVLSMLTTVYIVNPFISGLKGNAKIAFYIICAYGGSVATILGGLEYKTSAGKKILSKLGNIAIGLIFGVATKAIAKQVFKTAIEKIIAETVAEITAEEALGQIPTAGWALKIASVAADVAAITATTVECVLSPATYILEVQRTFDLSVEVKPDPRHGTQQQKPIWPLVSDHYVIQVKYPKGNSQEGGTTFTKSGPMPGVQDQPIQVVFEKIPAGGKIEVIANIYSSTDWLAGSYNSGWINASPDSNDQQSVSGAIYEDLVPLTTYTTYSQKHTLAYSNTLEHYWKETFFSIEASLATDLDKGGTASSAVLAAFAQYGNVLSKDSTVKVVTPGEQWVLTDNSVNVSYSIVKTKIFGDGDDAQYELSVQNTTNPTPGLPEVIHDCGSDGHRMCDRMGITINNAEYQLGYAWRASGQNLPRDYNTTPDNGQMYTFQSISTLASPQDSIIEPSRGFSNPTYIAYDQFGLTSLFGVDYATYAPQLNKGGAVPAGLVKEFTSFGLQLPEDAQVVVVNEGSDWIIGVAGDDPVYEMLKQSVVVDGAWTDIINAYSWPVPKLDNFYLDSRTYSEENKLYYLRGVKFATGESTFDYDQTKSWGSFQDATIKGLAVHPEGYVIGVDYDNNKLLTLRLPGEAVDNELAPIAMPLSGEGLREGLLNKPVALTITSEGRILILEEGNQRIQAFDIKGNGVPSFTVNQVSWGMSTAFISQLDDVDPQTDMVQLFQKNVVPARAPCFAGEMSSVSALDSGTVDSALSQDFVNNGYAKSAQSVPNFSVIVTTTGSLWLVTDKNSGAVFDVRVMEDKYEIPHLYVYMAFSLSVSINAKGQQWTIADTVNQMTFKVVKPKSGDLQVTRMLTTMPLRDLGGQDVSYLDIAVENKGYIYLLMQVGSTNPDYQLDIYSPDGSILLDKPQSGVNAARLTVDQWRSMFTMSFESIYGPGGRTEPGISLWTPSTPDESEGDK